MEESDRILLICDGITKVMDVFGITTCVEAHIAIDRAVDALTRQALARHATDDLTVLLVQVEEFWGANCFLISFLISSCLLKNKSSIVQKSNSLTVFK